MQLHWGISELFYAVCQERDMSSSVNVWRIIDAFLSLSGFHRWQIDDRYGLTINCVCSSSKSHMCGVFYTERRSHFSVLFSPFWVLVKFCVGLPWLKRHWIHLLEVGLINCLQAWVPNTHKIKLWSCRKMSSMWRQILFECRCRMVLLSGAQKGMH